MPYQGDIVLLTHADDDARAGIQLPCGQCRQDRRVVTGQADDDLAGLGHLGPPQQVTARRISQERGQAIQVRLADCDVAAVDDHYPVIGFPMAAQRVDGTASLCAVADDDDMIAHSLPPLQVTDGAAALVCQHSDGGADQKDQEADTHRGDEDGVQEPGVRGERGDVAVARGGHRHRRVVQGVDETDSVMPDVVHIRATVQPHDERADHQQQECQQSTFAQFT